MLPLSTDIRRGWLWSRVWVLLSSSTLKGGRTCLILNNNTASFGIAQWHVNGRACIRVLIGCVRQNDAPPLKMSWSNPQYLWLCCIAWQRRTSFLIHWSWGNVIVDYPTRPNVINNKESIHWKRETEEVRGLKMLHCWRKGPQPRECRWPQEVEKGRETDTPLETPDRI